MNRLRWTSRSWVRRSNFDRHGLMRRPIWLVIMVLLAALFVHWAIWLALNYNGPRLKISMRPLSRISFSIVRATPPKPPQTIATPTHPSKPINASSRLPDAPYVQPPLDTEPRFNLGATNSASAVRFGRADAKPPILGDEAGNETTADGPLGLDPTATAHAVRSAARAKSVNLQGAAASDEPARLNSETRFGRDVGQSAVGNCAKGEYAGGGMGLLSLPFFVWAEANGKCAK